MDNQIVYAFAKIELKQFALFEENYDAAQKETGFQTEVNFSYDKEQMVICNSIVETLTQDQKPILKAEQCSYFKIDPESVELLRQEDGSVVFDAQLLVQFASLNYGSMRGSIHIKTLGTPINQFILPPIYFYKMITSSFVVV